MSEERKVLNESTSYDLIMMALDRIGELSASNTELAKSIAKLDAVITNMQGNWDDLKQEIKETRHNSINKMMSIEEKMNQRIDVLEGEEKKRKTVAEEHEKSRKKTKERLGIWSTIVVIFGAIAGFFHGKWIKEFLESLASGL